MRIALITPAPPGSQLGNRVTAQRWERILGDLGHEVTVQQEYDGQSYDLLVALHARRSHSSIQGFAGRHPDQPLIVALTGTDVYADIRTDPRARESLELARRLVVLQPLAVDELPRHLRCKARVIHQSVAAPSTTIPKREDIFEVCVLGHLRPVKDPFRTARAARLLPADSRIQVVQAGAALSEEMATQARAEAEANPRYRWVGDVSRQEALGILCGSRLLALTSKLEGGANVISEAVVCSVPVIASRIAGTVGLLGEGYPGYFPAGDTQALADLLVKAERDPAFHESLGQACAGLAPLFDPARERLCWKELLAELGNDPAAGRA